MTDRPTLRRWRGLKDLVRDTVVHGASAVEQVHLQTAQRPFAVLRRVGPLAGPAAEVERVYNGVVTTSYTGVRAVTYALSELADVIFDVTEQNLPEEPQGPQDSGP